MSGPNYPAAFKIRRPLDKNAVQNDRLIPVWHAFYSNAQQIVLLLDLPIRTYFSGTAWREAELRTLPNTFFLLSGTEVLAVEREENPKILDYFRKMNAAATVTTPEDIGRVLGYGARQIEWQSQEPGEINTDLGLRALLAATLLRTWTTFEVLAADLWTEALNERPQELAPLTGTPTRIEKRAGGTLKTDPDDEPLPMGQIIKEEKTIDVADIARLTKGKYDIEHRMGELLRRRFKFSALAGIRRAYSSAFSEKEKRARTEGIDAALADRALDALSVVRNLIVHKAGIADQAYEDACKSIAGAPKVAAKHTLELDGEMVYRLVDPVIIRAVELAKAVDSWLQLTSRADAGKPASPAAPGNSV